MRGLLADKRRVGPPDLDFYSYFFAFLTPQVCDFWIFVWSTENICWSLFGVRKIWDFYLFCFFISYSTVSWFVDLCLEYGKYFQKIYYLVVDSSIFLLDWRHGRNGRFLFLFLFGLVKCPCVATGIKTWQRRKIVNMNINYHWTCPKKATHK
jgi:hypothetical protein